MRAETAFVGDVHGNLSALRGLLAVLSKRDVLHTVFLGDYLNKGAESAEVMQELVAHSMAGRATLLRGNHESALLEALDTEDLAGFLKMGGAMTIRSYVGGRVGPDVLKDLRDNLPKAHLDAIRQMPEMYETDVVVAQHRPLAESTRKYRISAHVPVGATPAIERSLAQLDTGCGTDDSGRLTALLWPSLDYVQVDAWGTALSR